VDTGTVVVAVEQEVIAPLTVRQVAVQAQKLL
jgi:hypothetical protein